jgi:serine/threonine-protein phosphatase 2A regulatory subunit A
LLTIPIFLALADCVEVSVIKSKLMPTLIHLIGDKSWRVRYMAANNYLAITNALTAKRDEIGGDAKKTEVGGVDGVESELLSAFVSLLHDIEAEVRVAAASQVPGVCALATNSEVVLNTIIPCVRELVTDPSQHVRSSIATQISALAPIIGPEHTINHLLSLFLQLLKDEFSEVRLNLISKLENVNHVIGIELLAQNLLPAIVELAEDKQWRVRSAIIEYIPLLAEQLGKTFFNEKLGPLCMKWLGDPVFAIREAACANLRKLTEVFGYEWSRDCLLPQIVAMSANQNYLFRMTTVLALTVHSCLLI